MKRRGRRQHTAPVNTIDKRIHDVFQWTLSQYWGLAGVKKLLSILHLLLLGSWFKFRIRWSSTFLTEVHMYDKPAVLLQCLLESWSQAGTEISVFTSQAQHALPIKLKHSWLQGQQVIQPSTTNLWSVANNYIGFVLSFMHKIVQPIHSSKIQSSQELGPGLSSSRHGSDVPVCRDIPQTPRLDS